MTFALFAPLLFGIAHVVNDFVFLFQKPRLNLFIKVIMLSFLSCIVILPWITDISKTFLFGMMGPIIALIIVSIERGPSLKIFLSIALYLGFYSLMWNHVALSMNAFIFLHNFAAFLAWYYINPGEKFNILLCLGLTLIGCGVISAFSDKPLPLLTLFLQLVHYLIWLKFIPNSQVVGPRERFWMKASWIVSGILLTSALFHISELSAWNSLYLQVFQFHGFMEFTIVSYLTASHWGEKVLCTGQYNS